MSRTGQDFLPWWDGLWEPVSGCSPVSAGCQNCYAQRLVGTLHQQSGAQRAVTPHYSGITERIKGKPVFNGVLKALPPEHPNWIWPIQWRGARSPRLGPGQPSLIFVGSMSDVFHENRDVAVIDQIVGTITVSRHIGLFLTRRAERMAAYFSAEGHRQSMLQGWQRQLWLGFSAERQREFDERWPCIRRLAEAGGQFSLVSRR